jgi:flagellar biosynthesis/type III secretory pathway protein FliH
MALRLEIFKDSSAQGGGSETLVLDNLAYEEAKLAAFDQGYQGGWDDAVSAQSDDQTRIKADLARNLQALSFSYHEARQHILHAIEPLMASIVERVLPMAAKAALAPIILETLLPLAQDASEPPITVVIHPSVRAAVEALAALSPNLPIVLQDEETLGEGTAYIRFRSGETQIDLDDAVARIARAVQDFFALNGKEPDNGHPR